MWFILGTVYVGAAGSRAGAILRLDPAWAAATLVWIIAMVVAADTGGYLVGRTVGGPKLAPRISPNKTWSGLGGAVAGAALAGLCTAFILNHTNVWMLTLISAVIGLLEQGGDLVESAFKRHFGVKDTSQIIPGHGGVLDRVDGLLAVAVAVLVINIMGGRQRAGMVTREALKPAPQPRSVTILGSTGSVGRNTIDIISRDPAAYSVEALTAQENAALLIEQAKALRPRFVAIGNEAHFQTVKSALAGTGVEVAAGRAAVIEAAARPAEWVMSAIVGAAGLEPTLAAIKRGAVIGLANKETLVSAGAVVMREVTRCNAIMVPVDSEHSAIFQCLEQNNSEAVEKIILTASGGPFRQKSLAEMAEMTPEQAVAHPNWSMGAKISVDSATMMNKGLELIEAHYLFRLPDEQIEILVHPQSVIHSMVAYRDGSVLAQLGSPDMRTPIAYALGWPKRISAPADRLDFSKVRQLTFEAPDETRFPALRIARETLRAGGGASSVLNAANEVAVAAFLGRQIRFTDIAAIAEQVLSELPGGQIERLDQVLALDAEARRRATDAVAARRRNTTD